jgi:Glutaredoxin
MPDVTIYTTASCPYCLRAKALLREKNVAFAEFAVTAIPSRVLTRAGTRDIACASLLHAVFEYAAEALSPGLGNRTLYLANRRTTVRREVAACTGLMPPPRRLLSSCEQPFYRASLLTTNTIPVRASSSLIEWKRGANCSTINPSKRLLRFSRRVMNALSLASRRCSE